MLRSDEYHHVSTGTLAILAQRLGKVFASPSTWYKLIHRFGWRRPRLRIHPASTIAVLLEAGRAVACSDAPPTVVADAGVENVNRNVDEPSNPECCAA
jgi:hypothetical protein